MLAVADKGMAQVWQRWVIAAQRKLQSLQMRGPGQRWQMAHWLGIASSHARR